MQHKKLLLIFVLLFTVVPTVWADDDEWSIWDLKYWDHNTRSVWDGYSAVKPRFAPYTTNSLGQERNVIISSAADEAGLPKAHGGGRTPEAGQREAPVRDRDAGTEGHDGGHGASTGAGREG